MAKAERTRREPTPDRVLVRLLAKTTAAGPPDDVLVVMTEAYLKWLLDRKRSFAKVDAETLLCIEYFDYTPKFGSAAVWDEAELNGEEDDVWFRLDYHGPPGQEIELTAIETPTLKVLREGVCWGGRVRHSDFDFETPVLTWTRLENIRDGNLSNLPVAESVIEPIIQELRRDYEEEEDDESD